MRRRDFNGWRYKYNRNKYVKTRDVIRVVQEAIEATPVENKDGFMLTVDEAGIVRTETSGDVWWRVPIKSDSAPCRLTLFCEVLADVEQHIPGKNHYEILLHTGISNSQLDGNGSAANTMEL